MAPSGIASSLTGMSRLESQNAALVSPLRCSILCLISSRRRMPQKLGIRPTALYGSIIVSLPFFDRHCEERSDEATPAADSCANGWRLLRFARNDRRDQADRKS